MVETLGCKLAGGFLQEKCRREPRCHRAKRTTPAVVALLIVLGTFCRMYLALGTGDICMYVNGSGYSHGSGSSTTCTSNNDSGSGTGMRRVLVVVVVMEVMELAMRIQYTELL